MKNNLKKRMLLGLMLSFLIFSLTTCDLFTPETYAEAESEISSFDDIACGLLTKNLFAVDTVISGTDTSIVNDTLFLSVNARTNAFTTLFDSLVYTPNSDQNQIAALFDSISMDLEMVTLDTTNLIDYSGSSAYVLFSGNPGALYTAFVSWDFTGNNVNDYVSIDFIDPSGNLVAVQTQDMPLETISGCTQEYTVDVETGEIAHTPAIKTRSSFNLDEKPYLMRLKVTQFIAGTQRVPLHLTILQND